MNNKVTTRFLLPLLLISLVLSPGFTQPVLQDSLLARHLDKSLPDTARMSALLALGNTNYLFDSLLYYHQQFETVFQEKGTPTDILEHTLQKGIAYFRTDRYAEALSLFQNGAQQAEKLADTSRLISALSWQGNSNGVIYNTFTAIEKYQETIALAEKVGDDVTICNTQGNIGIQFQNIKEYDKALAYYKRNMDCAIAQNNMLGESRSRLNIGRIYSLKQAHEKALEYMLPALEIAMEQKYLSLSALILINVGKSQMELEQFSEAKSYFERGKAMAEQTSQPNNIALAQLGLARLYRGTQPDSAIFLAQQALSISQEGNYLDNQMEAFKFLSELYQDKGQYQLALAMQSQSKVLEDSINRTENQRAVHQLEARLEYEKQQLADQIAHEQALAREQLRAQRQRHLLLTALALAILIFLSLLKFRRDRSNRERDALLHEIELLKERVAVQSVSTTGIRNELSLDKDKIEEYLGNELGESSWNILTIIFADPAIGNQELAQQVFLSSDGLSSSLRRMYKAFQVQTESSRNKKVALITKAVQISLA